MAPLYTCKVQTTRALLNRLHILLHATAVIAAIYHRFSVILTTPNLRLPWALLSLADVILAFVWALTQAFRWRPVTHSVSGQESIPARDLPGVDVFICTADPTKEPVVEVMNSVISAMALDYPPEKLAVYLSDDGGAALTRAAIREACEFAKVWVPFCGKYGVKTRCPEAFFSALCDGERVDWSEEYKAEELVVKSKYEAFKNFVEKASEDVNNCSVVHDRAPCIEIIHDNRQNGETDVKLPLLVYVSREKRPFFPHKFKAGALNALLRVSGLLSNGAYLLVPDCDMYCNDPTSARQSMCFHLDPKMAPTLAFVQYPQIFYNTSKNDIYDGQARSAYKTKWQGMDGLRGPVLTGTGYYLKRKALFGRPYKEDEHLAHPEKAFGSSSKFIASLSENSNQNIALEGLTRDELLQEARNLATCTYESNTQWGKEIGYSYECLLESTFTGYLLQCKGWKSVYLYPKNPCFLRCATIDMKDAMVQLMKWTSGLFGVGISKFSPLTYGMSKMSTLQSMCYGYFTFLGMVSDPWFGVYAPIFASSLLQHLYEVLSTGDTVKHWWFEIRIWIIKSVSACLFGVLACMLKKTGIQKTTFRLTNKVVDKDKLDKYEKGKFNFDGAAMFMVPLLILTILNLISFLGGLRRVVIHMNYDEMFGQFFLSFLLLVLTYPVLEGVVTKARKGCA